MRWNAPKLDALRSVRSRSTSELKPNQQYGSFQHCTTMTTTLVQQPFSSPIWVSWYQNTPFGISLELRTMEVVVTTKAVRRAKLQSNHHHQPTPSFFTNHLPFPSPKKCFNVKALKGTCSPPNSPGGLHTKGSCLGTEGCQASSDVNPLTPVPQRKS